MDGNAFAHVAENFPEMAAESNVIKGFSQPIDVYRFNRSTHSAFIPTLPNDPLTVRKRVGLGAVLFADPCMRRGVLQISELSSEHPMFAQATGRLKRKPKRIWGRRSVFYLGDKPLLVNEIFLPGIKSCKSLYNKEP